MIYLLDIFYMKDLQIIEKRCFNFLGFTDNRFNSFWDILDEITPKRIFSDKEINQIQIIDPRTKTIIWNIEKKRSKK